MAESEATQRLAAILVADVAGYSRLMQDDEQATVAALDAARETFRERIEADGGRVVDMAGDSVLAVFATATGAVRCALAVQEALAARSRELPEGRRMRFRLGVNLGEVIEKADGTVYGDGVNIAARMEALAEAGGICVSSTVYDAITGKLGLGFDYLGEHEVKNIAQPVRVYRVHTEARPEKTPRRRVARAVAAAAVAIVVVGAIWTLYPEQPQEPARIVRDKPAIAVLPFTNMSDDPGQEYFADGIAEDLITELSRFDGLLVIARNSTFRFKGRAVDIGEVSRALGARYVLEGGVRRAGERVRITAQLIDATTGGHLWAERYDRELTDVFAVQDDVTRQIIAALASELGKATATRGARPLTTSAEAYDLFLRGRVAKMRRTAEANRRAQALFKEAIARDPIFAAAYAELSHARQLAWYYGWSDDESVLDGALAAAEKAVALDQSLPVAHTQLGLVYSRYGKFDEAVAALRRAIALDTNYANAYGFLAYLYARSGDGDQALKMADKSVRLDPFSFLTISHRGIAHFVQGDYEQAIIDFKSSVALNRDFGVAHQYLAASYALAGRDAEARAEAAEVLRISPNFAHGLLRTPFTDRAVLKRLIDGLRKAGLEVPDVAG